MGYPVPKRIDAEAFLVRSLSPGMAPAWVGTKLGADQVTGLRITRASGGARGIWVDAPIFEFDAFDPDQATANDISRTAEALLLSLRGQRGDGGVISGVNIIEGPRRLSDPNPNITRSNATYEVLIHP